MELQVDINLISIEAFKKKLQNSQEFMQLIANEMKVLAQARIKTTKTDPDGRPWAPWAESTAYARRRAGSAGFGLLFDSGALYESFVTTFSKNTATIESTSPYAGFLQEGTPEMPARPFLGWGPLEDKASSSIWDNWLTDIMIKE
jgi:phage gpG-like protein